MYDIIGLYAIELIFFSKYLVKLTVIFAYCGSLSAIVPHKLIESDIISRCGLVPLGVSLLEEVCYYGGEI